MRFERSPSSMNGPSTGKSSGRSVSISSAKEREIAVAESLRKTYKYKLKPTPEQERELEAVLGAAATLYNIGVRATHHCLATARRHPHTLRAGSRVEGHARGAARIRGHPQPCLAGCAGAARQDVSGVLPPREGGETPGFPRFKGAIASTVSPTRSSATGPRWTMASWCCPRLGVSPCAGAAHWKGRPRPSRSAKKRMAGTSASPVRMCQCSRCRRRARRRALIWG